MMMVAGRRLNDDLVDSEVTRQTTNDRFISCLMTMYYVIYRHYRVVSLTFALVTVHRCLNGRAPPYLSDYCVPAAGVDTRQHLRSANRQLLAVPRYRLNTYGRRAFSVAGSTVWNSLPDFFGNPTISADSFRHLLKTYLFARY